jgi:ribose-phosphate pyrophosphokinase
MNNLRIFSGTANLPLSEKVASHLGMRLGELTIKNFSDSEIFVQIKESVRGKDVFVIVPTCKPGHYNMMELLIIIDALKRASAERITAVMPYFGYARQDRKDQPRVAITAKLISNLITKAGADRILVMDLHAAQIQGFFDIPVDHLSAIPVFASHVRNMNLEDLVIVSPDVGGVVRARRLSGILHANLAIIDKRRPKHGQAEVMHIIGEVEGKNLIIVDDIIDTAGTLSEGVKALFKAGAKTVMAFASHGVFSANAYENINNSGINRVFVTDTIPTLAHPKIEVLSVAKIFAQAIERIHRGESVGELFKE